MIVESYKIDMYCAEVKLNCSLYVYWTGHNNESYGENKYSFTGRISHLLVMNNSYKNISNGNNKFVFTKNYLNHCKEMDKLDKMDLRYLKMMEIAKNIIEVSQAKILFYELEIYTQNLLIESRKKLMDVLELCRPAIKKAKEQQITKPKKFSDEELDRLILARI